jgi:hypothetical protein
MVVGAVAKVLDILTGERYVPGPDEPPGALLIIALSDACTSYQLPANAVLVAAVPPQRRR